MMISILVAVRNFTIALMLAWMGFSAAPAADDEKSSDSAVPATAAINIFGG